MGEKQNQPFQLSFNALLKVDFQGSRVTSDGGVSGEETEAGQTSSAAPQNGQNERQCPQRGQDTLLDATGREE